ncbi:CAP domain-containing protein [soil metagenome]
MRRAFIAALLGLSVLAACGAPEPQPAAGTVPRLGSADAAPIRLRHLDAVNAVRAQQGAGPVRLSAELNAAAETHARDMAVQNRAWHFGSDLTSPRERAFRAGYRGEVVGENLSEGADMDLVVLESWLGFEDTRRIIVEPGARGLGLGWFQEPGGKLWWVQLLGR